jgi:SAM-dependent methyltransferase
MSEPLDAWAQYLRSPIDHQPLTRNTDGDWTTADGKFVSSKTNVKNITIADFRAVDVPQTINQTIHLPHQPLDRQQVAREMFHAVSQDFPHYNRNEIRQKFGTKLDKGMQYYAQQLWREVGAEARILDLGCGSGGNRVYLRSLGFQHVLTVDWQAVGADMLVDAHRLPLADGVFDMVISTAVLEHLYQPFVAMSEVARVLRSGGMFVGSASFWEAWHGSSYFHISPDGWGMLFGQAGMEMVDVWAGWGVLPALFSHVITPGYLRGFGYGLQHFIEGVYRLTMGEVGVRKLQLRASGSYQVCGKKV